MTAKDHMKVFKQLKAKPAKWNKFVKHNTPKKRKFGRGLRHCSRCGRCGAHIKKYGLDVCRQCFRDIARSMGFKKYS